MKTLNDEDEKMRVLLNGRDITEHVSSVTPPGVWIMDESGPWPPNVPAPKEVSIVFKSMPVQKQHRCHSHKRFVKLLMGYGYPRNVANLMACLVRYTPGLSFQEAWDYERKLLGGDQE